MYLTLKSIVDNKFTVVSCAALILVPYYTWKSLYNSYESLKSKYDEELLFRKRHNCVVMYHAIKGMSGWPPHTERISVDITKDNCLGVLYEPVIYFIDSAKTSLDAAFMLITVKAVYKAVIRAHRRGVKVRLLLNFEHCKSDSHEIRNLMKEGIEILSYVSQDMSSIMHYKYIVKDYTECSGFVSTGSLNFTESGFLSNYEDIVFTSNQYVARAFHENFEACWNFVKIENENLINKTTLLDANLA